MKPLYIFDLDGTLADVEHRRHFLGGEYVGDATRWRRFYEACDRDAPNAPVIATMERLRRFADVWIFSGRPDDVRDKSVAWLCANTSFMQHELETALVMRRAGDYRPDDIVKREFLDDRDRVVSMWRANGIACFQVAPGDF